MDLYSKLDPHHLFPWKHLFKTIMYNVTIVYRQCMKYQKHEIPELRNTCNYIVFEKMQVSFGYLMVTNTPLLKDCYAEPIKQIFEIVITPINVGN